MFCTTILQCTMNIHSTKCTSLGSVLGAALHHICFAMSKCVLHCSFLIHLHLNYGFIAQSPYEYASLNKRTSIASSIITIASVAISTGTGSSAKVEPRTRAPWSSQPSRVPKSSAATVHAKCKSRRCSANLLSTLMRNTLSWSPSRLIELSMCRQARFDSQRCQVGAHELRCGADQIIKNVQDSSTKKIDPKLVSLTPGGRREERRPPPAHHLRPPLAPPASPAPSDRRSPAPPACVRSSSSSTNRRRPRTRRSKFAAFVTNEVES